MAMHPPDRNAEDKPSGAITLDAADLARSPLLRRGEPPSLSKIARWLEDHDDDGPARCAYVELVYQTTENAAEEKAPTKADLWTVNFDLDQEARRHRFREIAELAWNVASDTMQSARVAHLWRVIRRNDEDQAVGVYAFKLFAEGETFHDGADPANEKGGIAAMLRVFSTGNSLAFQQMLAVQRIQLEREMNDRREILESRRESRALITTIQEALDRQAERQVRVENERLNLEMKREAYQLAGQGLKMILERNAPVATHIQDFVKTLDRDTLIKIAEALPTDEQRQKLMLMLNAFAEAEERERVLAEKKEKEDAEAAAKALKEGKKP